MDRACRDIRTTLSFQDSKQAPVSLGEGLLQVCGLSYVARVDNKKWRAYCIMEDGEQDERQIWEATMFAGKNKLHNLTAIIDRNNIQIDGFTEDVMPLEPLREKYESFGWHVIEVNGHDFDEFIDAIEQAKSIFEKPTLIIAHTIPGKGVDFMEFKYEWHGKTPKLDEAKVVLEELWTLGGKITSEHQQKISNF
jgi:transketolase